MVAAFAITGLVSVRIMMIRAEPILRARVIETLTTRFHSRVELAEIHVWIEHGIHVRGKGLKIFGVGDPNPWQPGVQPLLSVPLFSFETALGNLFRDPMRVDTIFVDGLTMNIPAPGERKEIRRLRAGKMSIAVSQFVCSNTKLLINGTRPDKPPLEFDIGDLRLVDIGPGKPFRFDAQLVNPRPVGNIHSLGLFGPIEERSPRDSAVKGTYSFTHADLSTFRGIQGILSSTGRYGGTLARIEVQGETDTPDFALNASGHAVSLHTEFHAIVDGTDGDTYLDPVEARILDSSIVARGTITRVKDPPGHNIQLNLFLDRAKIQDLLRLGIRTNPPVMTGTVRMTTTLDLPPSPADLTHRLQMQGKFSLREGYFSNPKLQTRIDSLSLRALGDPKQLPQAAEVKVPSELDGAFRLRDGLLSFSSLHFRVPGAHADLIGQYSIDGRIFDFHGTLKAQAQLSQMTTGWKSLLLRPVNPFFRKHGNGAEIPFRISGTSSEPHFGLDFGHKNQSQTEDRDHPASSSPQ